MDARKKKLFCGSCQKHLGKGSKICPQYGVIFVVVFTPGVPSSKISVSIMTTLYVQIAQKIILIENDDSYLAAFKRIHDSYTNTQNAAAFGSREKLIKATKCSVKQTSGQVFACERDLYEVQHG